MGKSEGRLHSLDPRTKILTLLATVIICVAYEGSSLYFFLFPALFLLTLMPLGRFSPTLLRTPLTFLIPLLAATSAVLIVTREGGTRWELWGLTLHEGGLVRSARICLKALLSVTAISLLMHTTPLPELTSGFRFFRVPSLFLEIIAVTARYIGLLKEELHRMRLAAALRGHGTKRLWHARQLGTFAGALFIRAHSRGERIQKAMLSRGYTAECGLPRRPLSFRRRDALLLTLVLVYYTAAILFTTKGLP